MNFQDVRRFLDRNGYELWLFILFVLCIISVLKGNWLAFGGWFFALVLHYR